MIARDGIWLWCARIVWLILPVTMGNAFADALDGWSTAPARVAAVLLWCAWAVGLLALLAPRPWGLTALRVVAPCLAVLGIVLAFTSGGGAAVAALIGALVAAALVLAPAVAAIAGNAAAYGDEQRFTLRIPLPLLLGPVPLALIVAGAGIAAGPIIVANGNVIAGIALLVVGWAVALVVTRSLHTLSTRWIVFVPAGVALVDPLTLAEPVLVRREHIAALYRLEITTLPAGAVDLRLGTLRGSIVVNAVEDIELVRRRGRGNAEVVTTEFVAVAATRANAAMSVANDRRITTG